MLGVVALLVSLLLPALRRARMEARQTACRATLAGVMRGVLLYSAESADHIVPSYNMTGVVGGAANPLDGWAPILDQRGYVAAGAEAAGNPLWCPATEGVAGLAAAQTGADQDNPRGFMEWPAVLTLTAAYPVTIPARGLNTIVRVSFWINGENLIGLPREIQPGVFFTAAAGYGPDPLGQIARPNRLGPVRAPARLIALADGLYAGQQQATRLGDFNSRIGYRHPGRPAEANIALADGHVGSIAADRFPRKLADGLDPNVIRDENLGGGPTVYADPERFLAP